MKKSKYDFAERRFLNDGKYHSLAAISVSGSVEEELLKEVDSWPFEFEFLISNCDRSIRLQLDGDSIEDLENSIFKIEQIEQTCTNFRKYLERLKPLMRDWETLKLSKKEEQNKNK